MKTTEIFMASSGEVDPVSGMPAEHAEARNMVFHKQAGLVGSYQREKIQPKGITDMSKTINAIERHMILPVRSKSRLGEIGFHSRTAEFVAEWQQRGPETLSGHAVRKLRLSFAPTQSVLIASAAG